jgi:outer membrane protein assembly factor BamB
MRRLLPVVPILAAVVFAASAAAGDWPQFGFDQTRGNAASGATGITASNVGKLVRQQVKLDGIADSNAIYLRGVAIGGSAHDAFFVTTSYGRTIAIDAATGDQLWEYVPPGIAAWDHSAEFTTAAPAADPNRRFLYAASPDGKIHKLSVADGSEVTAGGWPVTITLDPQHEKLGPGINVTAKYVLATTGGYIGDIPPYQGHVVAIDRATGRLLHVFNALCSDRHRLLVSGECHDQDGGAIWGRGGAVVEPGSGRLLVATGNGPYNGSTDWGDSVLELSPDAGKLLQAYTPANQAYLDGTDLDLGSVSPALLTKTLVAQAGKDGKIRLLNLALLNGKTHSAGHVLGGELQVVLFPGHPLLAAPAVWHTGGRVWLFVAGFARLAGYVLETKPKPRLRRVWLVQHGSSSPVVAGGLLYSFDPLNGGVHVYRPTTGALITTLPTGKGHWNSPIAADGRVAVPEGDSNTRTGSSVLDIFRLPGGTS